MYYSHNGGNGSSSDFNSLFPGTLGIGATGAEESYGGGGVGAFDSNIGGLLGLSEGGESNQMGGNGIVIIIFY